MLSACSLLALAWLPLCATALAGQRPGAPPGGAALFVAPNGNDAWSGRRDTPSVTGADGPFATLERARDAVRALRRAGRYPRGGVTVWVRGGTYARNASFVLGPEDSGAPGAPVIYRAYPGELPRLVGGRSVKGWTVVADSATNQRIATKALGRVWRADLREQGIAAVAEGAQRTSSVPARVVGLELYWRDGPIPLARWPNEGWARIAGAPAGQMGDRFSYEDERPAHWRNVANLWVHGFWTWDWADSYVKVGAVERAKREIVTLPPHGVYGYSPGRRWRALNALEEIDEPGEWCFERSTGQLFFWPPAPLEEGSTRVATLEDPLVSVRGASHVAFEGLMLECSLGAGVEIVGGERNAVRACTFRNLGTYAVWIGNGLASGSWYHYSDTVRPREGGERHVVEGCEMYDLGGGGILLAGGDRRTLAPSRHAAIGNHIHHYGLWERTYRAGVSIDGVGARVANNHIHHAPHQAIFVNGNDCVIELNEIDHVCMETNDAGAFYMGRDWTQRGNIVRWNHFHDLRAGTAAAGQFADVMAVYLDDWMSGTTVFGNLFVRAGRAVLIGGGRDNVVANNIFVDCTPAVHVDQRGLGWAKYYFDGSDNTLFTRLKAVNGTAPPYATRYPPLARILQDEPAKAKGNRVERNVVVGGRWLDLTDGLKPEDVGARDNWSENDPGFEDAAHGDYRLRKGSPVWRLGFEAIPFDRMGLPRGDKRREAGDTR